MKSLAFALLLSSASAFATPSACVVYMDNSSDKVTVQQSCDGADLSDLFLVSGMTAGMSKAIQYYMEKDYTFVSCSDAFAPATQTAAGNAYTRCTFVKK